MVQLRPSGPEYPLRNENQFCSNISKNCISWNSKKTFSFRTTRQISTNFSIVTKHSCLNEMQVCLNKESRTLFQSRRRIHRSWYQWQKAIWINGYSSFVLYTEESHLRNNCDFFPNRDTVILKLLLTVFSVGIRCSGISKAKRMMFDMHFPSVTLLFTKTINVRVFFFHSMTLHLMYWISKTTEFQMIKSYFRQIIHFIIRLCLWNIQIIDDRETRNGHETQTLLHITRFPSWKRIKSCSYISRM